MPDFSRASFIVSPMSRSNNRIKNLHEIDVICLYLHKVKASGRWPVPPRFRLALFCRVKRLTKQRQNRSPGLSDRKEKCFARHFRRTTAAEEFAENNGKQEI